MELSSNFFDFFKLLSLNQMFFQDHLYIKIYLTEISIITINYTSLILLIHKKPIVNLNLGFSYLIYPLSKAYNYLCSLIAILKNWITNRALVINSSNFNLFKVERIKHIKCNIKTKGRG